MPIQVAENRRELRALTEKLAEVQAAIEQEAQRASEGSWTDARGRSVARASPESERTDAARSAWARTAPGSSYARRGIRRGGHPWHARSSQECVSVRYD